jgi:very-short-patch-repair endonuclease
VLCGRRPRRTASLGEDADVRVDACLDRLGGVADRRTLLRLVSRHQLDRAVAAGDVVRLGRSRLALPAADDALRAAAQVRGVVSHQSAALRHGWKVKRVPAVPHVTVPRNRSRIDAQGVVVHWGNLTAAQLLVGVTSPLQTVVDCARTLPFDEGLAIADSALRSGAVTRRDFLVAASTSPRSGRAAALRVAEHASAKAANPFESVLRAIALEVPGLDVVPQGPVGAVGHADLTDERLRIAVEAESFEFHALPEAFSHDVRRYTAMIRLGWLVVRFVWDDVMHRPAYVRSVLADVVALRARTQAV